MWLWETPSCWYAPFPVENLECCAVSDIRHITSHFAHCNFWKRFASGHFLKAARWIQNRNEWNMNDTAAKKYSNDAVQQCSSSANCCASNNLPAVGASPKSLLWQRPPCQRTPFQPQIHRRIWNPTGRKNAMLQWLVIWAGPWYSLAAECCLSEIEMQRRTHCDIRNWESSHVCVCAKRQHFGFFLPNILRLHICEFCVYYMCILYAIWSEKIWDGNKVDQHPWPGFNPQNGHRRSSFVKPGMKNCSPLKHGSGLLFERHLWHLVAVVGWDSSRL